MFISSHNVETVMGQELTARLCQWLSGNSPVNCKKDPGYEHGIQFNIDEALEFCQIKMLQDSTKKEFFPHLAKLKNYQVCGMFENARSA
ncbi:MAG: hypothetical protein PF439_02065 [Helicobacteraceae bacterium]|jgi:hypothetical protein|nr:hypothetical protein [Helicobacteraceae bacterium]